MHTKHKTKKETKRFEGTKTITKKKNYEWSNCLIFYCLHRSVA